MKLLHVAGEYSICQLSGLSGVDALPLPFFLAVTDEEISLVCKSEQEPADVLACESGWAMLKIVGVLEFSMVGILARIASLLAQKEISIFVSSTYSTDYILVKATRIEDAKAHLRSNGYTV